MKHILSHRGENTAGLFGYIPDEVGSPSLLFHLLAGKRRNCDLFLALSLISRPLSGGIVLLGKNLEICVDMHL